MSARFFTPWEGASYRAEGYLGKRLLLVGESNYLPPGGGAGNYPELTRDVIKVLAVKGGKNGYSDRVLRLVTGASGRLSAAQCADFWHRVAFCNFIQIALSGPRVRPTKEMWAEGGAALLQTVDELKPDAILVLGSGVSWHLPPIPAGISVCRVKHPSSFGFSRKEWVPKIHAFISAAGNTDHNIPL